MHALYYILSLLDLMWLVNGIELSYIFLDFDSFIKWNNFNFYPSIYFSFNVIETFFFITNILLSLGVLHDGGLSILSYSNIIYFNTN